MRSLLSNARLAALSLHRYFSNICLVKRLCGRDDSDRHVQTNAERNVLLPPGSAPYTHWHHTMCLQTVLFIAPLTQFMYLLLLLSPCQGKCNFVSPSFFFSFSKHWAQPWVQSLLSGFSLVNHRVAKITRSPLAIKVTCVCSSRHVLPNFQKETAGRSNDRRP